MNDTNPIAQLRVAARNPLPTLIGACAGIVPIGVYRLGHYELSSWNPAECPKALLVYAGLVFSALTVLGWSVSIFGSTDGLGRFTALSWVKAIGFTALLEGLMMSSTSSTLSIASLTLIVAINAVANGCRLAVRDAASKPTVAERAAGKPRTRVRRAAPAKLRIVS